MSRRRSSDDDDRLPSELVGGYAIGGPVVAGARLLGWAAGEGERRSRDLGPAPIGSDPWLDTEIRRALGREAGLDLAGLTVQVRDAIVTLTGRVAPADRARVTAAISSVQGIKRLVVELEP